jgi:hypothetical protein
MPEPEFEILEDSNRALSWSSRGAGYTDAEAAGDSEIRDPPEEGELEVRVPPLVSDAYEDGEYMGDGPSYEGPWTFRLTL